MDMYEILEIVGTIAFAISGAMIAIQKNMDILGVIILGMTTAVGGGMFRDIIIGKLPPTIFSNPTCAYIAIIISIIIFLPPIRKYVDKYYYLILFIDAIGLGTFTVIGVKMGTSFNNVFLEVFLGLITGTGGGVIRDVFNGKAIYICKEFLCYRKYYWSHNLCFTS